MMMSRLFVKTQEEVESAYTLVFRKKSVVLAIIALIVFFLVYNCLSAIQSAEYDQVLTLWEIIPTIYISIVLFRLQPEVRSLILFGRLHPIEAIGLGILIGCITQAFWFIFLDILTFSFSLSLDQPFTFYDSEIVDSLLIAPPCEEITFHFGLQTMLRGLGPLLSSGLTVILFTGVHLFHGKDTMLNLYFLYDMVKLIPGIIVMSLMRWKTGSMLMLLSEHFTYNMFASIYGTKW